MIKQCKHHGETEFAKRKDGYYRCKRCAYEAVRKRRKSVLDTLKREHGGKCQSCGYSKSFMALEFHHINPDEKSFGISRFYTYGIDRLRAEAKKCILLCANCHREAEYPDS